MGFFFHLELYVCIVARSGSIGAFKLEKKLAKYLIISQFLACHREFMCPLSTCTLCKSLVGKPGATLVEIFEAYNMASVLYSSSRMKIPILRRPQSLPITDIAWKRSASVEEWLTRDRGADSIITGVIALCH